VHPQRLAPRTVTLTATAVTAKWLCLRPVSVGGGCRRSSRNNRNENIEGSSWFKSYTCSSWFCARHSHSSRHVCIIITCHARTVTCHSHKNDKMSKTCLVSQYIPSLGLISIYVVFHRQPHGVMTQTVSSDSSQLLPLKVRGGGFRVHLTVSGYTDREIHVLQATVMTVTWAQSAQGVKDVCGWRRQRASEHQMCVAVACMVKQAAVASCNKHHA
jgi:hypothetical protein